MTNTAHPAAYLRRSYVDPESPGDISRAIQRAAVRKLAVVDGHNGDLVEYDDWGVSADVAKSARRTAYTRLLADMEAGDVSAVYAFDVDRLYRDPRDLIRLQDAAQKHRVRIVTTGGPLAIGDSDDPAAEGFAFMGAVFGRMELQKAKKRNRATREARRARGDRFGHPPYGYRRSRDADGRVVFLPDPARPLEPVLQAFREAGTFSRAAWLLNERGVPSPRGKRWASNVVNRIIRREAPTMAPQRLVSARVGARGSQRFSRLLRCPCGRLMTPKVTYTRTKYGSYGPYTGYQCFAGRHDPAHSRPYMVNEPGVLEWAKAEAARFQVPADLIQGRSDDRRRVELEEDRRRAGIAYTARALSDDEFASAVTRIDAELAALDAAEEAIEAPQAINWDAWSPGDINAVLRTYWDFVELDADMRPVGAAWRLPAEYVA